MLTLRSPLYAVLATLAISCGGTPPPPTTPPIANTSKLDLAIASVTLADDCGQGPSAAPPSTASSSVQRGDSPMGVASMSQMDRGCEQSSMQLRVANGTTAPATITVKKVEVLDAGGNPVGELTPRAPSKWVEDMYQAWDGQAPAGQVLQVSYALSAPLVAAGATYTVRVTIDSGDGERTVEKQTTLQAEASLPPGAVT